MPVYKRFTLVLLRKGSQFLLGLKKRGFGAGKWNGFGGKIEPQETIIAAAKRELKEECHLECSDLDKLAILHFEFEGNPVIMEVHVFTGEKFSGTPTETEEMRPQWYDEKDIPYKDMWLDDTYWWPYFLRGQKFKGCFLYRGQDTILKYDIEEVDEVD